MPPATEAARVRIQYHSRSRASKAAKIRLHAAIATGEWRLVTARKNTVSGRLPCPCSQVAMRPSSATSAVRAVTFQAIARKRAPASPNALQPATGRGRGAGGGAPGGGGERPRREAQRMRPAPIDRAAHACLFTAAGDRALRRGMSQVAVARDGDAVANGEAAGGGVDVLQRAVVHAHADALVGRGHGAAGSRTGR